MISEEDLSSSFLAIKDKLTKLPNIDLSNKPLVIIIGNDKCGKTTLSEALFDATFEKDERNNLKSSGSQLNPVSLIPAAKEEDDTFPKIYSSQTQPFNILDTKNLFTAHDNQNLINTSSLLVDFYCRKAPKVVVLFVSLFNIYQELSSFQSMIQKLYNIFNSTNVSIYFISNRAFGPFLNDSEFISKSDEEKTTFLSMCMHEEIEDKLKGIEEENVGYLKKIYKEISLQEKESGSSAISTLSISSCTDEEILKNASSYLLQATKHTDGLNLKSISDMQKKMLIVYVLRKAMKENRVRYADPVIEYSIKSLKNDLINSETLYSVAQDFHFINVSNAGQTYISYLDKEISTFSSLLKLYSLINTIQDIPNLVENGKKRREELIEKKKQVKEEETAELEKYDKGIEAKKDEIIKEGNNEKMNEYRRIKESIQIRANELESRKNDIAVCYIIDLKEQKRSKNGDIEINLTFDYPIEDYKTEFDEKLSLESVFLSDNTFKAKISTCSAIWKSLKYLASLCKQVSNFGTAVTPIAPPPVKPVVKATMIGSNIAQVGINAIDSSFNNTDEVNGRILIYAKRKFFEDYNKEKMENDEKLMSTENEINKMKEEIENMKDNEIKELNFLEEKKKECKDKYEEHLEKITQSIESTKNEIDLLNRMIEIKHLTNKFIIKFSPTIISLYNLRKSPVFACSLSNIEEFERDVEQYKKETSSPQVISLTTTTSSSSSSSTSSSSSSASFSSSSSPDEEDFLKGTPFFKWLIENFEIINKNEENLRLLENKKPLFEKVIEIEEEE